MFSVFHKNKLIGHTLLEHGDPPMGIAHGIFIPSDEFDIFRSAFPGEEIEDGRMWLGFSVSTQTGIELKCGAPISIIELGEISDPFEIYITCHYISHPKYDDLFNHHVERYDDAPK